MNALRVLVLCQSLVAATAASAGDWAHWRGPEQNGISREKNLPNTWSLESGENVIWHDGHGGRSTPIVLNGRIYTDSRTPDPGVGPEKIHLQEQVICRDAATGKVIWHDRFNVFQTDIPAPRVGWAAMCGDPETGNVYLHSVSGLFRCYDADGSVLWEYSLFEEFGKISGYGGRTQTPIIDEERVLVSFFSVGWGKDGFPPKHTVYAFDKRTGTLLWISRIGGRPRDTNYSCPIVTVINGQRLLIGGSVDGGAFAIESRTGKPVWTFNMSKRGLNTTPVSDGNHVFISHGEDNIDTIKFGRVQCINAVGAGDITETNSVWRVDDIKAGYTALLVRDGVLYVVADTGKLFAFDSGSGQRLWDHSLGTVGKGSPVWADGKLYATEVNGRFHILRPSREGCQSLSHVELQATDGNGLDEIYASPAIADGRVYLVTRDRTICIGLEDAKPAPVPIRAAPAEDPTSGDITQIKLVPYETHVMHGGELTYELHAFDAAGNLITTLEPQLEAGDGLSAVSVHGAKVTIAGDAPAQAGTLVARHGELSASARLRVFPPLPWRWDFEDAALKSLPDTWINGIRKLSVAELDGGKVLAKRVGINRPSAMFWMGPPEMKAYTVQADVMMTEQGRKLPSVGITCQRYNFIIKGNTMKLSLQSWAPQLRMAKEIRFRSDPNVWYRMKMNVHVSDGKSHVRGKVWKRDDSEPREWTLEAVDPHPNKNGSPGLYVYSLADAYYDNIEVTQ